MKPCVRCRGRKELYKVANIYSYTNTGGVKTKCPLCLGSGEMKSIDEAIEEIREKKPTGKKRGRPKKERPEVEK